MGIRYATTMHIPVAFCTERHQVFLRVVAGVTAKLSMMDFYVRHRATRLTPPAITTKHLLS